MPSLRLLSGRAAGLSVAVALCFTVGCASGGGASHAQRGRGSGGGDAPLAVRPPASTVSIVLGHTTDLGITDSQRAGLVAIRRRLDSLDAPLYARLDSFRPTQRPANPRDLSQEQQDTLRVRKIAVGDVMTHFRDNNLATRSQVMDLLSADQQEKVAAFESDARRKEAEDEREPSPEGEGNQRRGGGRGGRGGGMGRPPLA